jgi:hypothetical protein
VSFDFPHPHCETEMYHQLAWSRSEGARYSAICETKAGSPSMTTVTVLFAFRGQPVQIASNATSGNRRKSRFSIDLCLLTNDHVQSAATGTSNHPAGPERRSIATYGYEPVGSGNSPACHTAAAGTGAEPSASIRRPADAATDHFVSIPPSLIPRPAPSGLPSRCGFAPPTVQSPSAVQPAPPRTHRGHHPAAALPRQRSSHHQPGGSHRHRPIRATIRPNHGS